MKYTGSCALIRPAKLRWIADSAGWPGRMLLNGAETARQLEIGERALDRPRHRVHALGIEQEPGHPILDQGQDPAPGGGSAGEPACHGFNQGFRVAFGQ